ncbi:hypothetical protein [uncultured Acinetobacter sp.]|uniref:hypothetical protein n=1 Tax=uncultured Acinetobacter sp. TaxID=165433 RepID=UPI0025896E9A|nr:hypothetical protein [uncultured Acinetobacter sp.]
MSNRMYLKNIFIGLTCFILGYGVSLLSTDDGSTNPSQSVKLNQAEINRKDESTKTDVGYANQLNAMVSESEKRVLSSESIEKIKLILDQMPEQEVNRYLSKAFPSSDLTGIHDKKKFSERLLEELSKDMPKNDAKLLGKLVVSSNLSNNFQSENMDKVYKNQQIIAHYDTMGNLTKSDQVFVKWFNRDTGEILLFTPQPVNPQSDQNWVSYSPPAGWKPGNYAIQYYQINDQLTPIAQTDYTITDILH